MHVNASQVLFQTFGFPELFLFLIMCLIAFCHSQTNLLLFKLPQFCILHMVPKTTHPASCSTCNNCNNLIRHHYFHFLYQLAFCQLALVLCRVAILMCNSMFVCIQFLQIQQSFWVGRQSEACSLPRAYSVHVAS